jgi:bifunctional DNA-binding transcriptional regulator/antitoxin component of YhaV-PrlF toxin-antitoxin module
LSIISKKNQITLPVDALRDAGLAPGDDVRVIVVAPGRMELVKVGELVAEFAGALDKRAFPTGYLKELRGEWP